MSAQVGRRSDLLPWTAVGSGADPDARAADPTACEVLEQVDVAPPARAALAMSHQRRLRCVPCIVADDRRNCDDELPPAIGGPFADVDARGDDAPDALAMPATAAGSRDSAPREIVRDGAAAFAGDHSIVHLAHEHGCRFVDRPGTCAPRVDQAEWQLASRCPALGDCARPTGPRSLGALAVLLSCEAGLHLHVEAAHHRV